MSKKKSGVSAVATQENGTNSSGTVASSMVQKRKTHSQIRGEGYDSGIRHCVVALLSYGYFRDDIADVFEGIGIPFPSIIDLRSKGLWNFDDWGSWVEAEQFD